MSANEIPIDDNIVIRGDDRFMPESGDPSDASKAYKTTDSASTTINDTDYIPMSDSSGNRKKSLWSTIVAKVKTALGIASSGNTYLKKDGTWGLPSTMELGFGYAYCNTAESTLNKVATLASYKLQFGGFVTVGFANNVPANSTLNINSTGAKPIQYMGSAIKSGVIYAGCRATFIYNGSVYILVGFDRTPIATLGALGSVSGALDPVTASKIGSAASNKTFGLPANAVTIEYSTDGGTTWLDYGATDNDKRALFNELRTFSAYLGKANTKELNSLENQLRITITPTDRYCSFHGVYIWMSIQGNTVLASMERSTIGAPDTYDTVFTDRPVSGWSGNNVIYFPYGQFGGSSTQTGNKYKYRLTFKQTALNTDNPSARIIDIRFIGDNVWTPPTSSTGAGNIVRNNRMYTWDKDFNVFFPNGLSANTIDATKLSGTIPSGCYSSIHQAVSEISVNANDHLLIYSYINDDGSVSPDTERSLPFVKLAGDTMTGTLILSRTQDASGTANNKPALIVGGTDTQSHLEFDSNEIMAKGSGTTTATLSLNNDGGDVYINGKLAAKCTSAPTSGQVMIADGTGGNIKSSGYTIAKSVPSDALFTDNNTTYTIAAGDSSGQIKVTPSSGSAYNVTVKNISGAAYKAADYYVAKNNGDQTMVWNLEINKPLTSNPTQQGWSYIKLGNSTQVGSSGNSRGIVRMFSTKTGYSDLLAYADGTTTDTLFLPSTSGTSKTLALQSSSSYRIKENIRDMTEDEALKILDVDVVKFDIKEEYGGDVDQCGVIAEEVIDIIPEVVIMPELYDETLPVDEASNPCPKVDYAKFAPYLIKMIQMQQERIDRLESIIEELRG